MMLDWNNAKAVFAEALALDPTTREEFVRTQCADDEDLRNEVLDLLSNHVQAGDFLEPATGTRPSRKSATSPKQNPVLTGSVLASRYLLRDKLGEGGGGTVYDAEDLLRGSTVAVKILCGIGHAALANVRREVAMLRFLRLPGVVQLLDDGIQDACGFIVMERVHGVPFPGRESPCQWSEIADPFLALLDSLANIHWAGVLHCDLKPANVLVDEHGVPTVLDLGVSAWQESDPRAQESGQIFGTLRFMAPERIRAEPPTVACDLFSLGVMVYHALSGEFPLDYQRDASAPLPFDTPPAAAAPLMNCAPHVPVSVARLIDQLVAIDPADRPNSAAAAHASFLGEESAPDVPRFTDEDTLRGALELLHAGKAVDVAGARGSGRTRFARDVVADLTKAGANVVCLRPAQTPLGSLAEMLPDDSLQGLGLEQVRDLARRHVRSALESGTVLIADDAENLDRVTAKIVRESREHGAILRTVPQDTEHEHALALSPATPLELQTLFAGMNRIHHLREDAADELWRRTSGLPAAVVAELGSWSRRGLARWDGGVIVVTRARLEQLRAGLQLVPRRPLATTSVLAESETDLLACLDLAGDSATLAAVADATDHPLWQIEADFEALESRGLVTLVRDRPALLAPTSARQEWPQSKRTKAHRAIAATLERGSEARIYHLIAGDQLDVVIEEVPDAARARLTAGESERALTLLTDGINAVRRTQSAHEEERFLSVMLKAALVSGTSNALDSLLYQLARCDEEFALRPALESIAHAALSTLQGDAGRAHALLDEIGAIPTAETQQSAWSVKVVASSYSSLEQHEAVVGEASAWAAERDERDTQSAGCDWLGWLRYRQHRFDDAASLHTRAAELAENKIQRVTGYLNAAWAALEAGGYDDVERLAQQARALAAPVRHATLESRAELMLRSAAYRRGDALQPDLQLARATRELGSAHIHGLVALNEAAVAWRASQNEVAVELAAEAARTFQDAGVPFAALLAETLGLVCGVQADDVEIESFAKKAASCPLPGVAVQILALLQRAHGLSSSWRTRGIEIAQSVPRERHADRREVLSIEEALDWLQLNSEREK